MNSYSKMNSYSNIRCLNTACLSLAAYLKSSRQNMTMTGQPLFSRHAFFLKLWLYWCALEGYLLLAAIVWFNNVALTSFFLPYFLLLYCQSRDAASNPKLVTLFIADVVENFGSVERLLRVSVPMAFGHYTINLVWFMAIPLIPASDSRVLFNSNCAFVSFYICCIFERTSGSS